MRICTMKEYDLNQLINNKKLLQVKIDEFIEKGILNSQKLDLEEVKGHILKAENNLRFVAENAKLGFFDWAIIFFRIKEPKDSENLLKIEIRS